MRVTLPLYCLSGVVAVLNVSEIMQQLLLVRLPDLYLSWSLQLFGSGIMNKTMVEICRLGELLKLKLVRSVKGC
jgi:hypothetical protein